MSENGIFQQMDEQNVFQNGFDEIDLKPNICNMLHLTRRPTWAVSSWKAVTTSKLLVGSTMTKAPMATISSQVLRMLVWLALCTRASTAKVGPQHLAT